MFLFAKNLEKPISSHQKGVFCYFLNTEITFFDRNNLFFHKNDVYLRPSKTKCGNAS